MFVSNYLLFMNLSNRYSDYFVTLRNTMTIVSKLRDANLLHGVAFTSLISGAAVWLI